MQSNILTPVTLWKDFNADLPLQDVIVNEYKFEGVKRMEVYFSGRQAEGGRPRIYARFAVPDDKEKHAAILIIPDIHGGIDNEIIERFAKRNYAVLYVDIAGAKKDTNKFTIYPKSINYANTDEAGRHLTHADETAKETSWYEWTAVARYAVSYLCQRHDVDSGRIGVIGLKEGANILWQLIGTDTRLAAAVPVFGAGWSAYKGVYKFKEVNIIEMDDERYRFLAGVDAHAYAQYANCPVLYLSCTNERTYDADRAFDTLARVNPAQDVYFNFSIMLDGFIDKDALTDIDLFFKKYLKGEEIYLPKEVDISIENFEGKVGINVLYDNCIAADEINVYYSEGSVNPCFRNYFKAKSAEAKNKNMFIADVYMPDNDFYAIAQVKYSNQFTITSRIVHKIIKDLKIKQFASKGKILYDSTMDKGSFTIDRPRKNVLNDIISYDGSEISLEEGPYGIKGITSKYYLKTYITSDNRFKPDSKIILKLDCYTKKYAVLSILVIKYNSETNKRLEFNYEVGLTGGEFWQNIVIHPSDFKNSLGHQFISFEDAALFIFKTTDKVLFNNIIWV